MKKMIIAAALVCAVAFVHAGTVTWGSGAMYTASGANGGWSNTGAVAGNALITMSVYLVDSETFASVSAKDQAGIYEWASTQTATYTAENKNGTGGLIAANTVKKTDAAASTTYYSIITAEYTDATYGDMYMAVAKSVTVPPAGTATVSNIFGGQATATTGGIRDWQAVPEPTSGLLLLLGVAGLALRRRRA